MNMPNCILNEYYSHSGEEGKRERIQRTMNTIFYYKMLSLRQGVGERRKKKKKILNNFSVFFVVILAKQFWKNSRCLLALSKRVTVLGSQVSLWGRRDIWNGRNCAEELELEILVWAHFWNMSMRKHSHVTCMHVCVCVCESASVCTCRYCLTLVHQRPRSQDTLVAMSTPSAQTLISNITGRNRTGAA